MAYLGKYIRQILSRQEPVILPGFGSLNISEGKGTRGVSGTIEPPGPVIRFDATHPKGDGKLAAEYAAGENIDPEEARQQVLELVDAIKFKLDKGEKYTLDLVGTFTRDDDNRIHFRKDPNWVIDPELFGLAELDLLELENEEEQEEEKEKEPVSSVAPEPKHQPMADKGAPVTGNRSKRNTIPAARATRKPVNKWKLIWIIVGSLIVVLILILMIPAGNGIEFGKDGMVLRDDSTGSEGPVVDKSESREGEHQEELTSTSANEDGKETSEETQDVRVNNFFIIAGSFSNLANATELKVTLEAKGFPAEIIITENRMYRVSIQSYPTKEEAVNDLQRVRSGSGVSGAWVLTR